MKQTALTLLGCSSFSAVVLLSQSAQANRVPAAVIPNNPMYADYVNPAPTPIATTTRQSGCSCQKVDSLDLTGIDLNNDDALGDLAIEQLGCDCAGCRNIAMQMARSGSQLRL
ncbi:MAG: hypothetical protein HC827_23325 [Cyanobacteria bacterium RM1_2_2]|nr:hypothetical protein [Cyanobacteria bacterium RM1_2_2]